MSSGVEFDEDSFGKSFSGGSSPYSQPSIGGYAGSNNYGAGDNIGGLSGWLIRHHLAKSPQSAQMVMVGVIIINIIITAVVIIFFT